MGKLIRGDFSERNKALKQLCKMEERSIEIRKFRIESKIRSAVEFSKKREEKKWG